MKNQQSNSSYHNHQWRAHAVRRVLACFVALALLLGAAGSLQAQYTYTNAITPNGGSGVNDWGTATGWSPNTVANGVDVAASFNQISNGVAYNGNLTLNGAFTVGSLWSTNSSGWLIKYGSGAQTLTLQTALTPQPLLYMGSSSSECWFQSAYIAGTQGFVFNSATASQKLTFRYNGNFMTNFSGPIIVGNGTLGFNYAGNFGYASSITLSNGTTLAYENANSVTAPTATFPNMPIILAGGTATIDNNNGSGVGTLVIQGPVESPGTNTVLTASFNATTDATILAGANSYPGNTTVNAGTLLSSTASTGAGSHTVAANGVDGALVATAGTSLIISNLTLTATTAANGSALAFCPGSAGMPTVPMINVTNQLTFGNTNYTTPIKLWGGGWQVGSAIPLLKFGSVTNVYTNGLFNGFQLAALPAGITAALADGTATNQINLNITAITPLIWAPATANANWGTNGNWTLSATATNYIEPYAGFGPAVQFDDSLSPSGSIIVTNNVNVSPNGIVFNNSTHNYTLLGGGGIQNNASLTMNGTGYVTNSLNNVYLGGTFLNAGTMVLNSGYALPYNAGQISFGGGTLQFSANSTIDSAQVDYSSRFSSAANQVFSLNTGGQAVTLATGLASSGGSLARAGAGTLTLKAVSTYTGATTNAAGTLKLGIANAIPTTSALTLGANGTSAILDLAGFNQQLAGLTMATGATAATITNSSTVNPVMLTYNGGASTYGGIIVDGAKSIGLMVGGGSLTLTGANAYHGNTLITNSGDLVIGSGGTLSTPNIFVGNGSTFDESANNYTTLAGGSINGIGTVKGNVEVVALSSVTGGFYGAVTNHGTLTFSQNLQLDAGVACNLNVDTTVASANNDKLVVNGTLAANDPSGNTINITAPAAALATGTDYTLITSPNTISGTFNSIPNWVGPTKPSNYAHYSVVTSANTVTLHYSTGVLLSGAGSVSPVSGLHQPYVFTVLVTPGTGSTGIGVTADLSQIGGVYGQVFAGSGNTYTYTLSVPGTIAPGTYSIPFTVTDAQSDTYVGSINITILNGTLVWDGAGADNNWSSLNWLNGATPDVSGDAGDALVFAGSTRLSPVMDTSYNVSAVTFSNNAGAFNVTTSGNTLTLAASGIVENDSTATESLDLPINLTSGSQFNTTAGNLIVGALANSVDGFTKNGSGRMTIDGNASGSSYSGNTTLNGGILGITNADNTLPTGTTVAYTAPAMLDLGGQNQTVANLNLSGLSSGTAAATNGNLTVSATTFNLSPNTAATATTTVDLSGLNSLTYNAGTIYFYGAVGANSTVKLAQTNNLTANQIYLANGGLSAAAPGDTATILLGQSNFLMTSTIQLGGYHNAASAIAFNTGLNNPTLTLRGQAGYGQAVGTLTIGDNNNGNFPSATFSSSAGIIDAVVNNLYVVNNNSGPGTASLSLSNGTLNAGNIFMNYDNGSTVNATTATINQSGGIVLVGNLDLDDNASTGLPAVTSIYNLGNGTNGVGLLSANIIQFGETVAPATSSQTTINFINGTIENYDPAFGQADTIGAPPAFGFSSQQNLDINGMAGGGAPNNYQTLNIVLSATGTHDFCAEATYTITEESTVLISGSGGLTANGPGLVTLLGTNTYTGNTTVSAGTLEIAQPCIATFSTVTVSNEAMLQLDFAATNQVAALIINGVSKAPGVYNSGTDPAYITNSGSLLVVPLSTNAYLTSLALNPADGLTPSFATNVFAYYATNDFGTNLTVTLVNANLFASNELFLNGAAVQSLISGVASSSLSKFGVGSTNLLQVLVTAQNGLATELYTIHLTELAAVTVNTNPATANFTATGTGNTLQFNWAPDHQGWQLYTNSVGLTATGSWFPVAGSASVTNEDITVNPAKANVFFQLRYP